MKYLILVIVPALMPSAAMAADRLGGQAPVLRALVECRGVADPQARLACYDDKVAVLADAEQAGKVVVADEAQIRQSKKALFGFGTVRLPILGSDDRDTPKQIEAKLVALRNVGYKKWEFTLDNGMHWRQTDDVEIFPKAGQPVIVKTAAMGSYFLKLPSGTVRVVRTQ